MKALLKQALDALEDHDPDGLQHKKWYDAISALRTAIAQPEPEPVAWMNTAETLAWAQPDIDSFDDESRIRYPVPLYAAPVQPAYVPLTDAAIIKIAQDNVAAEPGRDGYILPISFARAIEKAVRGKK